MPLIQAIVLGIVQGLTEFLPISSTAHLILLPWLFGWKDPGLAFDVALHIGTLAEVVPDERRVVTAEGASLSYDHLLLAVGARPRPAFDHVTNFGPSRRGDARALSKA